jgi:molybdopterin-guanine dinucleotide biosynthesis protein A
MLGGVSGLAGVVLCGGARRRMGVDKALLPVEGEPLVVRVAGRLAAIASPVLLATGRPGRLGTVGSGFVEVADAAPDRGPLGGLVAALEASPHALLAAVAVDMPFASPEVFRLLASMHAGEAAVVPVTESGPEPLHALYERGALPAFRAALAGGRLSMRGVLEEVSVRFVDAAAWRDADPTGRFAANLNRPEDLSLLGLG